MIVVDTNVLAYLYFPSAYNNEVEELQRYEQEWIAPALWKSEFLNVSSLYFRKKLISLTDTFEAFEKADELVVTLEVHSVFKSIMTLIEKSSCSSYDCEFIALAQNLGTKLITYDKKILFEFPSIALKPEDYLTQFKK